jgi:peroxiredoxin
MLPLGTLAPDFSLVDTNGRSVALADSADAPGLLVMFICNHCPFVHHIREELSRFASEYMERGLSIVGINSNDVDQYADESREKMAAEVQTFDYRFPYLIDDAQEVAKAYRAACTPDLFLFDRNRVLVYRGQFDDSRPGNDVPVTGADLRAAADAVLAGQPLPKEQKPSIGCNIKWKPGNAPDYFAS